MSWLRIDDTFTDHPKILRAGPEAPFVIALQLRAISYASRHLTDGFLAECVLRSFTYDLRSASRNSPEAWGTLMVELALWEKTDTGYHIHDYLRYNRSRRQANADSDRVKLKLLPKVRERVKIRDRNRCRYCGVEVSWTDRRSPTGATYDHVIPGGGNEVKNLVTACYSCNTSKGGRTPKQAGMKLLPVPRADLDPIQIGSRSKNLVQHSSPNLTSPNLQDQNQVLTLPPPPNGGTSSPDEFLLFARKYPPHRFEDTPTARKEFRKARKEVSLARIIEALERDKASHDWARDGGKYVPHPTKWLRRRRWNLASAEPARPWKPPEERAAEGDTSGLAFMFAKDREPEGAA